jgi:hypothetical protein
LKEISELFDWWERSTGTIHPGASMTESTTDPAEDPHHPPVGKKGKQERGRGLNNFHLFNHFPDLTN